MNKIYHNRLSGAKAETPNDLPIFGLWQLYATDVYLNTVAVTENDFLVPDKDGQWLLLNHDTASRQQGSYAKPQLLSNHNDTLFNSIKTFQSLLANKTTWEEWLAVSPLMPEVDKQIELQPLEKEIITYLRYLEEVCRKPHTHLEMDTERVPVSRVRRLSPRAATYLAAHTEDWEHRTISGVYPKRILSLTNNEYWNIYENRVAARLIDKLRNVLHHRINTIRQYQDTLSKIGDYSEKTVVCSHWLRTRICELWGDTTQLDEIRELAAKNRRKLEALYRRLMALMDSELYREIPRRAEVADELQMTNIFTNDEDYRYVALLWREYVRTEANKTLSPFQHYQDYQQLCQGFDNFCGLLIIRAFNQLKFVLQESVTFQKGSFLKLAQSQEGTVGLTWKTDGTFTVTQHDDTILHLVPIPAMLGTISDDNTLQQYLDNLVSAADNIVSTLILYPAPSEDYQLDKRLYTVGNEGFSKLGWLPVSPLKIHSVERVARALRWALGKRFLNYPPKINTTLDLNNIGLPSNATWLKKVSSKNQQLQVLHLPRSDEIAQFNHHLDNKIKEFEQSLQEKQQQRQQVQHNDNHRLRAQLKKEITELEEHFKKLTDFKAEMDASLEKLERLLRCPLCSEEIDAHYGFKVRNKNSLHTFWCECPNCKAIWGTQHCTSCHQPYPILLPNVEESLKMILETVGWMDERLGSDILVIPQLPFEGKFICPECGN